MDYFMHCPDMPLEPPEKEDNPKFAELTQKIQEIDEQITSLIWQKEDLKDELAAMGYVV